MQAAELKGEVLGWRWVGVVCHMHTKCKFRIDRILVVHVVTAGILGT